MSRIGKKAVAIPSGVTVTLDGQDLFVSQGRDAVRLILSVKTLRVGGGERIIESSA